MSRILLLLILIAGPLLPLRGEVFMLWPWKGGGTASGESLAGQLPGIGRMLHAEKMRVNGVDLQLKISAVNADFPLLLSWLAKMFRPENLQSAGGSVKVAYKVGRQVERWLLVDGGPGKPVTLFLIVAPEKLPETKEWPEELPELPAGAVPVQVVSFPGRKAVYGSFRNAGSEPSNLFRSLSAALKLAGWKSLGNEAEQPDGGTGGIFLGQNPRRILWANYGSNGSGIYYSRPY